MRRLVLVAALLAAACSTQPTSYAPSVIATQSDAVEFAGLWRGTLDAIDDRLDGDLEFRLAPGEPFLTQHPFREHKILWVRLKGNTMTGVLETYYDPERKSDVYMTFDGTLSGGVLTGRIRERVHRQWIDAGTWTASRVDE